MKIGFCGSQGTGKTSLAKSLLADTWFKERDWKFVPSTARRVGEDGFKVNRDADPLSQLVTTVGRITAEYMAEDEVTSLISDRTPLDSMAYTTYQYNEVWSDFNSKYYWEVSYQLVEKYMAEYDHVFYFPPYWAPKDDGLRDPDVGYQESIDTIIQDLLDTMGVECRTVPPWPVPERREWVKEVVCNKPSNMLF